MKLQWHTVFQSILTALAIVAGGQALGSIPLERTLTIKPSHPNDACTVELPPSASARVTIRVNTEPGWVIIAGPKKDYFPSTSGIVWTEAPTGSLVFAVLNTATQNEQTEVKVTCKWGPGGGGGGGGGGVGGGTPVTIDGLADAMAKLQQGTHLAWTFTPPAQVVSGRIAWSVAVIDSNGDWRAAVWDSICPANVVWAGTAGAWAFGPVPSTCGCGPCATSPHINVLEGWVSVSPLLTPPQPCTANLQAQYRVGGNPPQLTETAQTTISFLKVEIKRDEAGGAVDYQALTDTTRKVLPGQKIDLKIEVQPAGVTVTDWEWTLNGTTFKNYEANQTTGTLTPIAGGDLDDQTVHYYWADTADNREVKCKVKIGGQWYDYGKEVFHVKKPNCTLTTTLGTSDLNVSKTKLGLLPDVDSTKGITYTGMVQVPTGFAEGKWHFVQLVTPARRQKLNSGTNQHVSINGMTVLDSTYPYEPLPYTAHPGTAGSWATGSTSHTEGDSPHFPLDLTVTKLSAHDEAFSTYVMFLPPGTDSRYVPLRYVNWTWKVAATRGAGGWTLDAGSAGQSVSASAETSAHPRWTANVRSGGRTWVND